MCLTFDSTVLFRRIYLKGITEALCEDDHKVEMHIVPKKGK